MHMTKAIATAILAFCASGVLAAPVPQLAGEGSAANSLLSGTDNAIGYGTENILDNTANLISGTKGSTSTGGSGGAPPPPPPHRRQLGGEGQAADAILSDTDNAIGYGTKIALTNAGDLVGSLKGKAGARRQLAGEGAAANSLLSGTDNAIGYGTENILDNTADLISGKSTGTTSAGGSGGNGGAPPPPPPPHRRQLDKISAGVQSLSNSLGTGSATESATSEGETLDGQLTSGAANAGASLANAEDSTVYGVTSKVPKRQLDKISAGVQSLSNALGTGSATEAATSEGETLDGQLTSGAANAGAELANAEDTTVYGITSKVPKRQLDKISKGVATLSNAAGTGGVTNSITTAGVNLDGELTGNAGTIGQDVGKTEEDTIEDTASAVPSSIN